MRVLVAFSCVLVFIAPAAMGKTCSGTPVTNLADIQDWLQTVNKTMVEQLYDVVVAEWNWATDINLENEVAKAKENAKIAEQYKILWEQAACQDCVTAGCSAKEKRRVDSYGNIGTSALPADEFDYYGKIQTAMANIYSTAKVCGETECVPLDPNLYETLATSTDYCTLQWAWEGWRNESGRKMRIYYPGYIMMQNNAAKLNDYAGAKEMWLAPYLKDEPDFYAQIEQAWQDILPLYRELHAYARLKLIERYGAANFPASGHIPAHLGGNMWSQDWEALYPILVPYPDAPEVDITKILKEKGYTEIGLHEESDSFFQSIGLDPMTKLFWDNSYLTKRPDPIEMVCHASAWNFQQWTDFRVKMCTVVNAGDFQTVHHEMGHIQYYMQYKTQPIEFRTGANPGFHEAIGDLIALSVMNPTHYKAIGLLEDSFEINAETSLNSLMSMALQKLPFMAFGYLMDKYRWDLFDRKTSFNEMNDAWWKLRCDMQGVSPPVPRTEEDFDAGSKYHIPASVPYIRYFFSHVAQFQFHKSICNQMGVHDEIHLCDFYDNKTATADFVEAMKWGASEPYPDVMEKLTGSRTLNATAMRDYFKPLEDWLIEQNKDITNKAWQSTCSTIKRNDCVYPTYTPPDPCDPCDNNGPSLYSKSFVVQAVLLALASFFVFQ